MILIVYHAIMKEKTINIILIIIIIICCCYAFLIYYLYIRIPPVSEPDIMYFSVGDGMNYDDEHGCFFVIRAGKGVDINPYEYSIFVAEEGYSFKQLDFNFRYYWEDENRTPFGGDRNASGCPTCENFTREPWSDGEYIGFDMPMEGMDIDIINGAFYEVMIKDPNGEIVYKDSFVYTKQERIGQQQLKV